MITKIWIDADNCPSKAKKIILSKAIEKSIKVTLVANRPVPFDAENPLFEMIVCEKQENAADDYIVENCSQNELVVTRDLPFAKRLVDKNITVMNDRGLVFDKVNIIPLLKDRELALNLAAIGVNRGARFNTYSDKDVAAFSESFCKIIG